MDFSHGKAAQLFRTQPKSAQAVTHEVQPAEPAMSDKPKRRWHWFVLRMLLAATTLAGVVLGIVLPWRAHRQFCLDRAEFHRSKILDYHGEDFQFPSGLLGTDEEATALLSAPINAKYKRLKKQDESHQALSSAYLHAVWRPWERFGMDDSLPPDENVKGVVDDPESDTIIRDFLREMAKNEANTNALPPKSSAPVPSSPKP